MELIDHFGPNESLVRYCHENNCSIRLEAGKGMLERYSPHGKTIYDDQWNDQWLFTKSGYSFQFMTVKYPIVPHELRMFIDTGRKVEFFSGFKIDESIFIRERQGILLEFSSNSLGTVNYNSGEIIIEFEKEIPEGAKMFVAYDLPSDLRYTLE